LPDCGQNRPVPFVHFDRSAANRVVFCQKVALCTIFIGWLSVAANWRIYDYPVYLQFCQITNSMYLSIENKIVHSATFWQKMEDFVSRTSSAPKQKLSQALQRYRKFSNMERLLLARSCKKSRADEMLLFHQPNR